MRSIQRFKREIGGMSRGAWAVVCLCTFIIALGAGMGVFTPAPSWRSTSSAVEIVRPSKPVASAVIAFPICGWAGGSNCVVDGDTFRYQGETIRIADIDAPEIGGAKCQSERALGERAKRRLSEILSTGAFDLRAYQSRDEDRFGRKLRIVVQDGRSIGGILISEGLVRPWQGRRRPWCNELAIDR